MRRLLAILLLISPVAAISQTAGTLLFNGTSSATINKAQCNGADAGTEIDLAWTITMISGNTFPVGGGGQYRVFATTGDPGAVSPYCYTPGASGQTAGKVTTNPSAPSVTTASSSAKVTTSALAAGAGYDCTIDKTIYVCVTWYADSGSSDSAFQGYAKGQIKLSVGLPDAPVIDRVEPGEDALKVWIRTPTTPISTVEAVTFRAVAVAADGVEHFSPPVAVNTVDGTVPVSVRIEGLAIGTTYTVTAYAYSADGNRSAASAEVSGPDTTPQEVLDFWEYYSEITNGRDDGGCQAGGAGLAALLGAAALLRLRRRS